MSLKEKMKKKNWKKTKGLESGNLHFNKFIANSLIDCTTQAVDLMELFKTLPHDFWGKFFIVEKTIPVSFYHKNVTF